MLFFLIFGIGRTLFNQSMMFRDLNRKKAKEAEEIAQLEKDIEKLKEDIENKDKLDFIERIAREELRMVRPREIIYIDKSKKKGFLNFVGE